MGKHDDLMKECNVYQEIAYSQLSKEELSTVKEVEVLEEEAI